MIQPGSQVREKHPGQTEKLHLKIGGMQCSFCVSSIKKALTQMQGVRDVAVSLAHEEVLIRFDPDSVAPVQLNHTLSSLGYTVQDPLKVRSFEEQEVELRRQYHQLLVAAGVVLLALGGMAANWLGYRLPWFPWVMGALSLGTVFGVGRSILEMAWASLRRGILNQHVLMEFGAFGGLLGGAIGFFIQPWPMTDFMGAAIFITAYHILSGYVSLRVRTRSSQAIRKLMDLRPAMARVIRNGQEQEVPVEQVRAGDRVRIRPGESIPVDGEVVAGASAVDQSLVTGESVPVDKTPGDAVIGGMLNQTGTLLVATTHVGEESFLQQVARSIEEARALKPGIMLLVDRVLKYFVPAVLIAASAAFLIWTLGAWLVAGAPDFNRAIFAALAVLVMGYPCALGMAAPLAMIRGGGMAAQKGILMRSGEAFQVFKDVTKIVLDKTGTITLGKPVVVEVVTTAGNSPERVLALAAAAEQFSEHPLARAIVEHAEARELERLSVTDFQAIIGCGVRARVDGAVVRIESLRCLSSEKLEVTAMRNPIARLERNGYTVVAVSADERVLGLVAISDTLKEDARDAIERMKTTGLEPIMISGDTRATAEAVAAQVGIDEVSPEVLPEEKAERVRLLQQQGFRVAMVGDGINDAPALMQADVGIAIGAGTDIAIESADIVLIGEQLGGVVDAYHIGKSSYRKTLQNVALAFAFNGIGVPAAITGLVHPAMAMIAMAASVTTVLLNSFAGRLLPRRRLAEQGEGVTKTVTLKVPSMHCVSCLARIREALNALPGVENVAGDLAGKLVIIRINGSILGREQLCEALGRIGHSCDDTENEGITV